MYRKYRIHEVALSSTILLLIVLVTQVSASTDSPLDTAQVYALGQKDTGKSVESSIVLEKDREYRIVVSGVFQFRRDVDWGWADAQFRMGKGDAYTEPFNSIEFNGEPVEAVVSDVENHTYTYYRTGDGEKIRFSIFDCLTTGERGTYDDNAGALRVEIYPATALSVTKVPSPHTIKEGDTTTVTVTVRNAGATGTGEIRDIVVTDSVPPGFKLMGGSVRAEYPLLKPDESRTLQYVIKPHASGTFNLDQAEVSYSDGRGEHHTARSDGATLTVVASAGLLPTAPQNASVKLHGERTDVVIGDNILLKLSAVNLITKPVMHVQVIIIPPSGMSVASSGFAMSGAGQFTSDYEIEPGVGRNIEVVIVANQVGNFTVEGLVVYYFGDDIENDETYTLELPIRVRSADAHPPPATPASHDNTGIFGLPGWSAVFVMIGLLIVVILLREKRGKQDGHD
ncbi:MAG: BatD family protein [Euryarchaeota archaeon]|nr:BatD family protein [Euryarchaeota archaeon]